MFSQLPTFLCRNHKPLVQLRLALPRYLFSCASFPLFFLCCAFLLVFPTTLFPAVQQDSMEQEQQYLAFIFVVQTDLGRSRWSSKSIGRCEHEHLAHPCHGSAPELLALHSHCQDQQVAHRSYFPCPTALFRKERRKIPKNMTENWESFGLPCGGDHCHCPGFVGTQVTPVQLQLPGKGSFL